MAKNEDVRISNVVMMGTGEPLDNLENVLKTIGILNDSNGYMIGGRHISVSTCGILEKIEYLKSIKPTFTLSLSLHAATDEIRDKLMPVNRRYGVKRTVQAVKEYGDFTKRRVCIEYILIDGLNDRKIDATNLIKLLKGGLFHVNLISANFVKEVGFKGSDSKKALEFAQILNDNRITCTIRRRLGQDIDAACGQLRNRF